MNEKQLAKLIKKTTAKAEQNVSKKPGKFNDATLQNRPDHDDSAEERSKMFDEMKRREF